MTMRFIGIDPGVSGAIAMLEPCGQTVAGVRVIEASVRKMPSTERDLLDLLEVDVGPNSFACLEFVRAMPRMGVASMFKFGQGYGALRMALVAANIPFDEVTPQKWQKAMQCRTGGDKNVSKRRAQELFPTIKVSHWNADALLIAEYCRRLKAGELAA